MTSSLVRDDEVRQRRLIIATLLTVSAVLLVGALVGFLVVTDLVDRIDAAGREASQQTCASVVKTRTRQRDGFHERIRHFQGLAFPSPEKFGILGANPANTAYSQRLWDGYRDFEVSYYQARLELFPPLRCTEHNNRLVPLTVTTASATLP